VLGPLVIFGTLALTPPLGVLVVAGFVGGLLFGPINPIASTVIQEHTSSAMLGRVFGALTALAQAGIPIGAVLAGVIVQRAGLVPTIVGMGALYLLVPLGRFFNRALRQMDTGRRGENPRPAPGRGRGPRWPAAKGWAEFRYSRPRPARPPRPPEMPRRCARQ
jgi:MFS family permease